MQRAESSGVSWAVRGIRNPQVQAVRGRRDEAGEVRRAGIVRLFFCTRKELQDEETRTRTTDEDEGYQSISDTALAVLK